MQLKKQRRIVLGKSAVICVIKRHLPALGPFHKVFKHRCLTDLPGADQQETTVIWTRFQYFSAQQFALYISYWRSTLLGYYSIQSCHSRENWWLQCWLHIVFLLHAGSELHKRAAIYALEHQQTLNAFIAESVNERLSAAQGWSTFVLFEPPDYLIDNEFALRKIRTHTWYPIDIINYMYIRTL